MKWDRSTWPPGRDVYVLRGARNPFAIKDDWWNATVMLGDDNMWIAMIEPEDLERYAESYVERFPTLEEAKAWCEIEMKLDGKI